MDAALDGIALPQFVDQEKSPIKVDIVKLMVNIIKEGNTAALAEFHSKSLFIGAMHFQDAYNFDLERVRRCGIHYVIPDGRVIGISKLARLVDIFARRLQIQERIGEQVTTTLMEYLRPRGAACIIEATHLCMRMRGIEKQRSVMITSSMKGAFFEDSRARAELLSLIG